MLFNSYTFLIFLFFIVVFSRAINSWKNRKLFLLIVSYLFYSAWNPPFVLLLWVSTIADWIIAKKIYKVKKLGAKKKFLLLSFIVNLGLLSYFKYGTFILDNFVALLDIVGLSYHPLKASIILPVGISFYTFQTLSYSFDIYKGKSKPCNSFLDYALYVSFFPQLVAGPIVRAANFLPQCILPKKATMRQIGWGLILFIIGLFNKIVVADTFMSPIVEKVFDSQATLGFVQAWVGTMAFSVQIFCDFAGYSTCAIGVALILGFALPDNFHFPYAAIGFSDFWKRWHISLSSWLKDYLYVPLGGNKKGTIRTYANLMVTMLIGGLWHGASWIFIIWGGIHGAYLAVERVARNMRIAQYSIWSKRYGQLFLVFITYIFVCVAWVFFRSPNLSRSMEVLLPMFGLHLSAVNPDLLLLTKLNYFTVYVTVIAMLIIHWVLRGKTTEDLFKRIPWGALSVIIVVMAYSIIVSMNGEERAFIYFQF